MFKFAFSMSFLSLSNLFCSCSEATIADASKWPGWQSAVGRPSDGTDGRDKAAPSMDSAEPANTSFVASR